MRHSFPEGTRTFWEIKESEAPGIVDPGAEYFTEALL